MINISKKTLATAQLTVFSAIIFLLAFTPFVGYIPLGFTRATIVHIPVIIGSIVLGPKKGAFLGTLFGFTSLIMATFQPTVTSFVFSPFYSVGGINGNFFSLIICFVPRILVGIIPFYVFLFLDRRLNSKKRGQFISLSIAGIAGSLTNTLLVMNLIYFFFKDSFALVNHVEVSALYRLILSLIGINGIPEAIVAAILATLITRPLLTLRKQQQLG